MADVVLEGGERLMAALKALEVNVAKKIVTSAVKEGAKIQLDRAEELAPINTGLMSDTLKVGAAGRKRGRVGRMVKTATRDKLDIPQDSGGYYPYAVEFGTVERVQKTTGRRTGRITATHFMHNAVYTTEKEVLQVFQTELEMGINDALSLRRSIRGE